MAKIKKAQFGAPIRKGGYRGGCAATTSAADRAERREGRQAEREYKKAVRVAGREERKAERAEKKVPKAQAGLKASNKRVGPVDPQGAWTKVQEQTIAGKKTPVSLTRDKELGATKMAKKGVKVAKAQKGIGVAKLRYQIDKDERERRKKVPLERYEASEPKRIRPKVKAKGGKWIQSAIKKPGALRAQLGAKPGKPIPAGKLAAAAKKPGKLGQRARLAQTLKKMKK